MKRFYQLAAQRHFERYRQMLFVAGPGQVGKTTVGRHLQKAMDPYHYFNWDNVGHRELIAAGPDLPLAAGIS